MTKMMTAAALAAAMMLSTQATMARDQADAAGTGQANDNADVANLDQSAAGAAQSTDAAQPAAARQGAQAGQVSEKDQKFVMKAASSGMFEVAASKLAQQQGQSEDVKRFAQQMVEDHTKANQQLMKLAQSKGIQVPQEMMPLHQAMLQELQKEKGADFDRAYLISEVAEHNKAVLKFRDASTMLQDSDLKQFATTTLPKLRQHLTHVEQMAGVDEETTAGARQSGDATGAAPSDAAHDAAHDPAATPAAGDRQNPGAGAGSEQTPGAIGGDAGAGAGAGAGAASDAATDREAR